MLVRQKGEGKRTMSGQDGEDGNAVVVVKVHEVVRSWG